MPFRICSVVSSLFRVPQVSTCDATAFCGLGRKSSVKGLTSLSRSDTNCPFGGELGAPEDRSTGHRRDGVALLLDPRLGLGRAVLTAGRPTFVVEREPDGACLLGDVGRHPVGRISGPDPHLAEPARRACGEDRSGRSQREPPMVDRTGEDARQPFRRRFACPDRVIARRLAAAVPARPFRARRSGRGGSGRNVGVPNGTRTRVPTLKGWCPDL